MGSLAAAIFHSTGPTHEGGLVWPQQLGRAGHWGLGEGDKWAERQERGVPEGKEGHLYAPIGVFLCWTPFILPSGAAAGAQLLSWVHFSRKKETGGISKHTGTWRTFTQGPFPPPVGPLCPDPNRSAFINHLF